MNECKIVKLISSWVEREISLHAIALASALCGQLTKRIKWNRIDDDEPKRTDFILFAFSVRFVVPWQKQIPQRRKVNNVEKKWENEKIIETEMVE